MTRSDKDIILQSVSLMENVDEENHARTLEALIREYNSPDNNYELLDSIECDEFKKYLENIDLDRNPAAEVRPIKHTHAHATSATSVNVDPVVTGARIIGREGSRAISGRSITQEIPGRKVITHSNIITTDIMDTSKVPPSGGGSVSFLIREKQTKAFVFTSLVKTLLVSTGHVRTTSVPRARWINKGRMLAPTMIEDVPCRNYVRSTVLSNVRKSDELDTTVDGLKTNKNDAAGLRNVEDTPKGIFHENIKKFDSSNRVDFADSNGVKTPELATTT